MPRCSLCGAHTELIDGGGPVCIDCATERGPRAATMDLAAARDNYKQAREEFDRLLRAAEDLPAGHPDGTALLHAGNQLLHEAGSKLSKALVQYQEALMLEHKK